MLYDIVTYANRAQGMYAALVNNKHDVKVITLGWGTKWNGFTDKFKAMKKYLVTKSDDDIVVFLDGFDTKINKDPRKVADLFREYGCKVLVSKDPALFRGGMEEIVFGTCKNGVVANSGMYMGYAKELKMVIDEALSYTCKDDQRNLNSVCRKFDFIEIDNAERVFKNVKSWEARDIPYDAIFVSYPGTFSFSRMVRAPVEYLQFLFWHLLCIVVVALALLPRHRTALTVALGALCLIRVFVSDTSCVGGL